MRTQYLFQFFIATLLLFQPVGATPFYETPQDTLEAYLSACKEGDFSGADACYTRSSRTMLERMLEGQPERDPSVLKQTYSRLGELTYRTERVNSSRSVLWPSDETVPPFCLRVQDKNEGWRIDYHFMSRYVKIKDNGWSWRNPRIFKIWKSRS